VLFSEPKIPQFVHQPPVARQPAAVSVLFSEPKIPQLAHQQALGQRGRAEFQCSSASRKFLNA